MWVGWRVSDVGKMEVRGSGMWWRVRGVSRVEG